MIEVMKMDPLIRIVLSEQKLPPARQYKWSVYAYHFQKENANYIYNTLTKQCYLLEASDNAINTRNLYTTLDMDNNASLGQLAKDYFLVQEHEDEDLLYENLTEIARSLKHRKQKKGFTRFTILPTTACNARCFYCFEAHKKPVTMTPEMIEQVTSYILSSRYDGKIHLHWFGGEPLICSKAIDTICRRLRQQSVDFYSTMVSNGSLITDEIADNMAGIWNLELIQISLDGDETEYNHRKQYHTAKNSPYRVVMDHIGILLRHGIKVRLRCNVDSRNLNSCHRLIEDLNCRFPDKTNLSAYFTPLYEVQAKENSFSVWESCFGMNDKLAAYGFSEKSGSNLHQLALQYCMAQNPHNNIVIAPDGLLYTCEHCLPGTAIGTITNGISENNILKQYSSYPPVPKKCSGCAFLPNCTTFSLCPITRSSCKELQEHALLRSLHRELS